MIDNKIQAPTTTGILLGKSNSDSGIFCNIGKNLPKNDIIIQGIAMNINKVYIIFATTYTILGSIAIALRIKLEI